MADEGRRRYLFVAIDTATRWVFVRIYLAQTATNARRFLRDLARAAPMKITRILTDRAIGTPLIRETMARGKAFTDRLFGLRKRAATGQHEFDQLCADLSIEHRLTPPMRPQTNGMLERFNGWIEDVLQSHRFQSGEDLEQTILRYVTLYNSQLPQSALATRTPLQAMKDWHKLRPELFKNSHTTLWDVTVPALRIVTDVIWQNVKKRQCAIRDEMFSAREEGPSQTNPLNTAKRPTHLLSGLLKRGCCGAGYTMMNKDKYGCSGARNRGTCENRRLIHRVEVEDRVLGGLRDKLMHPALLAEFISEYQWAWNEACKARNSARQAAQSELRQVLTQIDAVITAITEGMYHPSMKGKMDGLEARKADLEAQLGDRDQSLQPIRLHPGLADVYWQKITALSQSLNNAATRLESAMLLRGLITQIRLVPDETASGGHLIEIFGELGAILSLSGISGADINEFGGSQSLSMVAGAGFEPAAFRL